MIYALIAFVWTGPVHDAGLGTWYGAGHYHGSHTANGDVFKPFEEVTCAHRTIPLGSRIKVVDPDTKRSIVCHVTDRGPYMIEKGGVRKTHTPGRPVPDGYEWSGVVDLSAKAALKLGVYDDGLFRVRVHYPLTRYGGYLREPACMPARSCCMKSYEEDMKY